MPSTNHAEICRWISSQLRHLFGDDIESIFLVGSRAKGLERPDSDWDIALCLKSEKGVFARGVGPLRYDDKIKAPDGNDVEYFRINRRDLSHERARENIFISDVLDIGIDITD